MESDKVIFTRYMAQSDTSSEYLLTIKKRTDKKDRPCLSLNIVCSGFIWKQKLNNKKMKVLSNSLSIVEERGRFRDLIIESLMTTDSLCPTICADKSDLLLQIVINKYIFTLTTFIQLKKIERLSKSVEEMLLDSYRTESAAKIEKERIKKECAGMAAEEAHIRAVVANRRKIRNDKKKMWNLMYPGRRYRPRNPNARKFSGQLIVDDGWWK